MKILQSERQVVRRGREPVPAPRAARLVGAWVAAALGLAFSSLSTAAPQAVHQPDETTIAVDFYDPNLVSGLNTIAQELMRNSAEEHERNPAVPRIQVVPARTMSLPGVAWRAAFMMSMAADIGPDVIMTFWHETRHNIREGFLMPLNEYIGGDANGNGLIDDEEATWAPWRDLDPVARLVATVDGKVYGLPMPDYDSMALVVRADLFRAAGLDPTRSPKDWDSFLYMCQKLTMPGKEIPGARFECGQRAMFLTNLGWQWLVWLKAAGGQCLTQYRTDPSTGRRYAFKETETVFTVRDPVSGQTVDLARELPEWRATFAGEAGVRACEFFHRLCWQRWIRLENGEPLNLTPEDTDRGWAVDPRTGGKVAFDRSAVITGVVRPATAVTGDYGQVHQQFMEMFRRGEVAIVQTHLRSIFEARVPSQSLSFFPIPPRDLGEKPQTAFFGHLFGLNQALAKPENKARRDAAWRLLSEYCGQRGRIASVRADAELGYAKFIAPTDLKRAGLDAYVSMVPEDWRASFETLEMTRSYEPFSGFWLPIQAKLESEVLSLIQVREDFDYAAALKQVEDAANAGMMVARGREELAPYRPWARGAFVVSVSLVLLLVVRLVRVFTRSGSTSTRGAAVPGVYHPALPWLMLCPSLLFVLLWSYYPLARGSVMAFQDYHILAASQVVGLDNFIEVSLSSDFWRSFAQTLKYVVLSLGISFLAPIGLAILLHEIPHGKVFFRTLYFLPQVSSGIVVMMIWMLIFDPTPSGLLNQAILSLDRLLGHIGIHPHWTQQNWLGDPRWAMLAVIIPTVWATSGIASLIYLAALKSVDEEAYEAAEIDGAGIGGKLRHITLPYLKPLMLINFLGAFVATFMSMENILVMTGGGPGRETMVISLLIWLEAYVYQRYSRAVAMAWILGLGLIAFTVYQLRLLRKVEFRRVEDR